MYTGTELAVSCCQLLSVAVGVSHCRLSILVGLSLLRRLHPERVTIKSRLSFLEQRRSLEWVQWSIAAFPAFERQTVKHLVTLRGTF